MEEEEKTVCKGVLKYVISTCKSIKKGYLLLLMKQTNTLMAGLVVREAGLTLLKQVVYLRSIAPMSLQH